MEMNDVLQQISDSLNQSEESMFFRIKQGYNDVEFEIIPQATGSNIGYQRYALKSEEGFLEKIVSETENIVKEKDCAVFCGYEEDEPFLNFAVVGEKAVHGIRIRSNEINAMNFFREFCDNFKKNDSSKAR